MSPSSKSEGIDGTSNEINSSKKNSGDKNGVVANDRETMTVTLRDLADHLLLSALWGASFLFMRVAAPEFGPFPLMGLRCLIGAITLIALLWWTGGLSRLAKYHWTGMAVGVLNSAIPFVLLAYAALSIGSGMLSVINSLVPVWGAVIGWLWLGNSLTRWQISGLVIGLFGVVVLVSAGSQSLSIDSTRGIVAILAGIAATVFYGFAANFAKRFLTNPDPMANATNSQIGATVVLLLPTVLLWPDNPVSLTAWLSVITLGVFSTGFAYVLFFRLVERIGASGAVTVVFVVPLFAASFGALLLDEVISSPMVVAGILIILGSALSLQLIPRKMPSSP